MRLGTLLKILCPMPRPGLCRIGMRWRRPEPVEYALRAIIAFRTRHSPSSTLVLSPRLPGQVGS